MDMLSSAVKIPVLLFLVAIELICRQAL